MVLKAHVNHFFEYIHWVFEECKKIQRGSHDALRPLFRIVEENYEAHHKCIWFTVQITGKNIYSHFAASELLKDGALFAGFSASDQKKIQQAVAGAKIYPLSMVMTEDTYTIAALSKKPNTQQTLFKMHIQRAGKCYACYLTAQEIINNKSILMKLSREDMFQVAYTAGMERILHENQHKEKAKSEFTQELSD